MNNILTEWEKETPSTLLLNSCQAILNAMGSDSDETLTLIFRFFSSNSLYLRSFVKLSKCIHK